MKRQTLAIALTASLLGSGGLVAQTATDANVAPPSQDQMQAAMTTPQAFAERAASSTSSRSSRASWLWSGRSHRT